jgi:hypothetical protein
VLETAMAAMTRHVDNGEVAEAGLAFLFNVSLLSVNVPRLRAAGVWDVVSRVAATQSETLSAEAEQWAEQILTKLA